MNARRLLLVLLALPLATAALAGEDPAFPARGVLICSQCAGVTLGTVEIRGVPGKPAPSCGVLSAPVELRGGGATLQAGTLVAVTQTPSGGWVRIRALSGEVGYAPAEGVTAGAGDACRPLAAAPVPLRRTANATAAVDAELPPGTAVAYASAPVDGWLRVRGPGGEEGYVPDRNVKADGAAEPARGLLAVRLGTAVPTDDALRGWHNGPAIELSAGRLVTEHVRLELTTGWHRMKADAEAQGPTLDSALEGELKVVPILAGVTLALPAGPAEVSATFGAGVGLLWWDVTQTFDVDAPTDRGHGAAFLTQLGLGASAPVGPGLRVVLGARWLLGSEELAGLDTGLGAVVVTGGLGWER